MLRNERGSSNALAVTAIVLIAIVAFIALYAFSHGFRRFDSGVEGKTQTIEQKNNANNRIGAQAFFEDQFTSIKASDRKIDIAEQAITDLKETAPSKDDVIAVQQYKEDLQQAHADLRGIQNICQDQVAAYNSEARKTIRAEWRAPDLPYQIGDENSTSTQTDCQANN